MPRSLFVSIVSHAAQVGVFFGAGAVLVVGLLALR
jgi:hypothetical protein